jgi:hypothetical protein
LASLPVGITPACHSQTHISISASQAAFLIYITICLFESLDRRAALVPQHHFLLYYFQFVICQSFHRLMFYHL